jgi:hypothetical protein
MTKSQFFSNDEVRKIYEIPREFVARALDLCASFVSITSTLQRPHFAHGDLPFKFWGDLVLTEPGAQRTKGEPDCVMDVSSSFV